MDLNSLTTGIYSIIALDGALTQLEKDKLTAELNRISSKYRDRIDNYDLMLADINRKLGKFNITPSSSGQIQALVDKARDDLEKKQAAVTKKRTGLVNEMESAQDKKQAQINRAGNYVGKFANAVGLTGEKLDNIIGKVAKSYKDLTSTKVDPSQRLAGQRIGDLPFLGIEGEPK